MTVGDADTLPFPQFFSTVTLEFRRLTEVVPRLTAVTLFSTVMFELVGLMNRDFCSRHAYSLFTMSFALACHRLVWGLGFRRDR